MVLTKVTFTSVEMDFPNFDEFMNYNYHILGHDKFMELAYVFSDPIIEGTMLPYEKVRWADDGKSGFVQRYHESSLQSKDFQLKLTKLPAFVELQHLLGQVQISVSIESSPSDEMDLNNGNLEFIDITSPSVLKRTSI